MILSGRGLAVERLPLSGANGKVALWSAFFMGAVAPDRILYLFQAKWHVAFINIFSVVSASPVVVVVFLI